MENPPEIPLLDSIGLTDLRAFDIAMTMDDAALDQFLETVPTNRLLEIDTAAAILAICVRAELRTRGRRHPLDGFAS